MSNANMDGNGNNKHIIIITIIRSGVGWRVVFFGFLLDGWIAFQQKPPKKKRRRRGEVEECNVMVELVEGHCILVKAVKVLIWTHLMKKISSDLSLDQHSL